MTPLYAGFTPLEISKIAGQDEMRGMVLHDKRRRVGKVHESEQHKYVRVAVVMPSGITSRVHELDNAAATSASGKRSAGVGTDEKTVGHGCWLPGTGVHFLSAVQVCAAGGT